MQFHVRASTLVISSCSNNMLLTKHILFHCEDFSKYDFIHTHTHTHTQFTWLPWIYHKALRSQDQTLLIWLSFNGFEGKTSLAPQFLPRNISRPVLYLFDRVHWSEYDLVKIHKAYECIYFNRAPHLHSEANLTVSNKKISSEDKMCDLGT